MTPLRVMRFTGWTLTLVGLMLIAIGCASIVVSISSTNPWSWAGSALVLFGLLAVVLGLRYATRTPTESELKKWSRGRSG
jgi:uncharacterized membrane protein HdeD (DUF308 family)